MLHKPDSNESAFRIFAIDPGTDTLGYAVLDVDIKSFEIVGCEAHTLRGSKLAGDHCWYDQTFGNRYSRIHALGNRLQEIMIRTRPIVVVSEAPFFNRFHPQAYGSLVETIATIQHAVRKYDPRLGLDLIDPPSVKKGVGAGRWAKKLEVYKAVKRLKDLNYNGPIPLGDLDEHSIDAIAVGYTHHGRLYKEK